MADQDPVIDHDPAFDRDTDSVLDNESIQESTASITSSLLAYREIHGRTYQASNTTEYWAPNDEKHIEAFDVAHQWLTMIQGDKLYSAPIGDNPHRILDIGTGTGIWAIDMGDEFPSAEVIGIDISPTQPSWVPPNVSFQIDDAQLDWTFKEGSFDFIHVRYMHGAIGDWNKLYQQMYKFLKPGGWFQHMEPNIELRPDNPEVDFGENHIMKQWHRLFYSAGDVIGREFRMTEATMRPWAEQAGFTNITHKKIKTPVGPWAKEKRFKEIGAYTGLYMNLSLDGFAIYPIGQILGWSLEEVQALVANMRSAIKDPRNRTVSDMQLMYGQKPEYPYAAATTTTTTTAAAPAAPAEPASAEAATTSEAKTAEK